MSLAQSQYAAVKNKPVFRTSGFLADVSIVVVAFCVPESAGGVVVADAHIVRVGFSPRPVAVRWLAAVVPASHLVQSNPEFSTGGPALMSQFHKAFRGSLLHIGCLKKGVSPPPKHCSSQKKMLWKVIFHTGCLKREFRLRKNNVVRSLLLFLLYRILL